VYKLIHEMYTQYHVQERSARRLWTGEIHPSQWDLQPSPSTRLWLEGARLSTSTRLSAAPYLPNPTSRSIALVGRPLGR